MHIYYKQIPNSNFPLQKQRTSYSNIVQTLQRKSQNIFQPNYNFTTRKHDTTCSSSTSEYTNTTRYIHKYFSLITRTFETF